MTSMHDLSQTPWKYTEATVREMAAIEDSEGNLICLFDAEPSQAVVDLFLAAPELLRERDELKAENSELIAIAEYAVKEAAAYYGLIGENLQKLYADDFEELKLKRDEINKRRGATMTFKVQRLNKPAVSAPDEKIDIIKHNVEHVIDEFFGRISKVNDSKSGNMIGVVIIQILNELKKQTMAAMESDVKL